MKNLIQDTLEKIKAQKIAPAPRWKYLVREYGLWGALILVIVLSAAALSVAHYSLVSLDWDLYPFLQQSFLRYAFSIFPFFWVIILGLFFLLAFFDLRRTATGYRFNWVQLALIIGGSVLVLGLGMSWVGWGGKLNGRLAKDIPYYGRHMMVMREAQWMQPERGLLAGTIERVTQDALVLIDLEGKKWEIEMNQGVVVRPAVNLSIGEMVKIIGTKKEKNVFKAGEIRPWIGRGMMPGGGRGMMGGGR